MSKLHKISPRRNHNTRNKCSAPFSFEFAANSTLFGFEVQLNAKQLFVPIQPSERVGRLDCWSLHSSFLLYPYTTTRLFVCLFVCLVVVSFLYVFYYYLAIKAHCYYPLLLLLLLCVWVSVCMSIDSSLKTCRQRTFPC